MKARYRFTGLMLAVLLLLLLLLSPPAATHASDSYGVPATGGRAAVSQKVEANRVAEITLISDKIYQNPFMEVELDAIITQPDGIQLRVPAFWAGGNRWCFRYASAMPGLHNWRSECSDKSNPKLQDLAGTIGVAAYHGLNTLCKNGPLRVAKDQRHFEQADSTPFFWLADTWWKGLCKRLTWEGFQELTADRSAKGFSVIQIVCGPYPDEGFFKPSWENEGGQPYLAKDLSVINPKYFEYADRRLKHLVDSGLVPATGRKFDQGMIKATTKPGDKDAKRVTFRKNVPSPQDWVLVIENIAKK